MKRMSRARRTVAALLLGGGLLVGAGCDQHVAGEMATLSGSYLGNVVTVVVTRYLQTALGLDAAADAPAHSEEPLHDHEH